jgi:hypothetical protein
MSGYFWLASGAVANYGLGPRELAAIARQLAAYRSKDRPDTTVLTGQASERTDRKIARRRNRQGSKNSRTGGFGDLKRVYRLNREWVCNATPSVALTLNLRGDGRTTRGDETLGLESIHDQLRPVRSCGF